MLLHLLRIANVAIFIKSATFSLWYKTYIDSLLTTYF